jgi:hypothetical protein
MRRVRRFRSWLLVGSGLFLGLAIGGALATGVYLGSRTQASSDSLLAELRLKAMASHGAETFAIATGAIDEEAEALFTLDFLTGDLQGFVLNPRTGKQSGWFKTNVAKDLPVEKGKKPSYLLVTGQMNWAAANIGGNTRPADSLVWVADANTGVFAAYTIPWTRALSVSVVPQAQPMSLLFAGKARTLEIRE